MPRAGVLGAGHRGEGLLLDGQPLGQRPFEPPVDGRLGQAVGHQRRPGPARPAQASASSSTSSAGTTRLTSPMASASSAGTWRPVKMSSLARDGPDEPGQALGAAAAGDDPEEHLGQPELGVLGADPEVAGQGQLQPAAQGVAVDGGDGGPGHGGQGAQGAGEVGAHRVGAGPSSSTMSAPAAKIRRPPHSTTAPGGSSRSSVGDGVDLAEHGAREGVHLGPVEPDQGDAVGAALDGDERCQPSGHRT